MYTKIIKQIDLNSKFLNSYMEMFEARKIDDVDTHYNKVAEVGGKLPVTEKKQQMLNDRIREWSLIYDIMRKQNNNNDVNKDDSNTIIKHKMWTIEQKTNYSVTSNNAVNNIINSSIKNESTDDGNNSDAQQNVKIWYQNIL